MRRWLPLAVLLVAAPAGPAQPAPTPPDPTDESADRQALASAGLTADDAPGLLGYVRQRTLSDADLARIRALIQRFGVDDFEERLKASYEVRGLGPAAVTPLRTAAREDPDPEVAYRALECLRRLEERGSHAAVARAAVRALARLKPPETASVLLAYLPAADSDKVAADIRLALTAVAVRDGKAEPALVAALADGHPARRAAAAVALIEGGPAGDRVRVPDAYPKVLAAARAEPDPEARFQVLYSLLTVAREKEAVGLLLDAIPVLPRGRLWQTEDYLIQLAGADAPKAPFGKPDALPKTRDAWKGWWEKAGPAADLATFNYAPRLNGFTVLVLADQRTMSGGAVVELGPDLKERWRIGGLNAPMDAGFLPDGTVAIAEHNSNRVTIRDTTGRIKETRTVGGNGRQYGNPQQVQVLPDGNLLVTCRNLLVEFKKDKDEPAFQYVRNQYDLASALRLPGGETVLFVQQGPDHCIFLDAKGKEMADRKLKIGQPYYLAHAARAGDDPDRVLFTEPNQVAEYDLKKGEKVWSKGMNQPRSVQRLPNGNTLVVDAGTNRLVEFTPDGDEVWSYSAKEQGMQLFRAYRR